MAKKRKTERDHEIDMALIELVKGVGAEVCNVVKEGAKAWGEFAKSENDMVQAAAIGVPVSWSIALLTYLGLKSIDTKAAGAAAVSAGIATEAGMIGSGVVMELAEVVEHMKMPALISFG